MKEIKTLAVWGDSLMKGVIYDDQLCKYHTSDHPPMDVVAEHFPQLTIRNNSRFGNVIGKGQALIEKAAASGRLPDAAIVEFGGNDCDFNWQEVSKGYLCDHSPNTPLDIFKKTLEDIVTLLRENGVYTILMNLPPISAEKYFDWFCLDEETEPEKVLHWLKEKQIIYRTQEMYSHTIDITAKELSVPLLDIRTEMLKIRDYDNYLCTDGIHPDIKGQQIIARSIVTQLEAYL